MRRYLALPVVVAASALVLVGCSDNNDNDDASGAENASTTASTTAAAAPSPLVEQAVTEYQAYAVDQTNQLVAVVKTFTDAVKAGDLQAAQAAYAPSRVPWERIEPLAGLIEEIDAAIDARADDYQNDVDNPEFTGWHRLEYLLFDQNTTEGGAQFADQLVSDVATLQQQMPTLSIPPVQVPVGATELVQEVSMGKITGEEERYSKTDLWVFDGNLEGAQVAIEKLTPALREADAALLEKINTEFSDIYATLAPLRQGDGWVLYCLPNDPFPSSRCPEPTVQQQTIDTLKSQLGGLSENMSLVAGVLKLQ